MLLLARYFDYASKVLRTVPWWQVEGARMKVTEESATTVHVLVVDDYEPFRHSVSAILRQQPKLQVVGEAKDGLEAVQMATGLRPDLILLDIGLPRQNGMEAARRIRKNCAHTKILFVTQNDDPDLVGAALTSGAQGYVLKAEARTELPPAIEAVLRGEKFVSKRLKTDGLSGREQDFEIAAQATSPGASDSWASKRNSV